MKKTLITIALTFVTVLTYGQQDAQYTQYMYNTNSVNPAYAGTRESTNFFLLYRTQWVGLEGAPVTSNLSADFPVNENLGIGISVLNDEIGPSNENNLSVDFSYKINLNETYKLSFGLKATANLLNIDFNKLNKDDQNDYSFDKNVDNQFSPNIGTGIYLYSDNTYFGLSVPSLLETSHFDRYANTGANTHLTISKMNFYFTAGHVFDLNENIQFKPSILTKFAQGSPLNIDLSANFLIQEKLVIGAAYRWSAALSAMVGIQATDNWFIGYSYDMATTKLANYNSGTHEIFLRYEILNGYTRYIAPRFF